METLNIKFLHNMKMIPLLLAFAKLSRLCRQSLLCKKILVVSKTISQSSIVINVNLHDFWNIYEGVNAERRINFF